MDKRIRKPDAEKTPKRVGWVTLFSVVGGALVLFGAAIVISQAGLSTKARSFLAKPKIADIEERRRLAPVVSVAPVVEAEFVDRVIATGSLEAREEVAVAPEVEGLRITEVKVEEGAHIAKGDLLAVLASEPLEVSVAQAKALKARAEAAVSQAKRQIVEAQARSKNAKKSLKRARKLRKSRTIAKATFENRETTAVASNAQLEAARDGLALAKAEKDQVLAQGREAQWRKSRTEVRAPASGIIGRRKARIGDIATSATGPMFTIIKNGEIELEAEISDVEMLKVRVGQPAELDLPGVGRISGQVRLVAPEVDRRTRLGRVRILFGDWPDLRVGTFVRAQIIASERQGLAVPAGAVMYRHDGTHVQVVNGAKIETRAIEIGLEGAELVEVKAGLERGEVVVAKAGVFLRNGDNVRPQLAEHLIEGADQ